MAAAQGACFADDIREVDANTTLMNRVDLELRYFETWIRFVNEHHLDESREVISATSRPGLDL
jgi:hypothetical protein